MSDQTDRPQKDSSEQSNFIKEYAEFMKESATIVRAYSLAAIDGLPKAFCTVLDMPKRVQLEVVRPDASETTGEIDDASPWQTLWYRIKDETGGGRHFTFDPINRRCLKCDIPDFRFGPTCENSGEIVFALIWLPVVLPIGALSNAVFSKKDKASGMSRHARNFLRCLKGQVDEPTLAIIEDCLRHPVGNEECPPRPRPPRSDKPLRTNQRFANIAKNIKK